MAQCGRTSRAAPGQRHREGTQHLEVRPQEDVGIADHLPGVQGLLYQQQVEACQNFVARYVSFCPVLFGGGDFVETLQSPVVPLV